MKLLRFTLNFIGIVQMILGVVFLLIPAQFATMFGLSAAPVWVHWLFAMFAARSLGFAYGMFLAAREPERHIHWAQAMIGVQAIDWAATIYYLLDGAVTLAQVTTAAFLPLLFIAVIIWRYPRQQVAG